MIDKKYHVMLKIFISLLLITYSKVNASSLDSLTKQLSLTKTGKEKVELQQAIGRYYHKKNSYDSAIYYYSIALNNNKASNKQKLLCCKELGSIYIDSTNYTLALEYLNRALLLNKKVKAIDEYPTLYDYVGMCNGLTNNLDEAIVSFEKGLKYNIQIQDSSGMGFSYNNIGIANHFQGHYEIAIENFVKSANIRKAIGDTTPLVASLISIGEIFRLREEYTNAEIYYSQALMYKQAINNKEILAYLYSELALIYKATEQYTTALAYIDTAMDYSLQIDYKRGIVTLLSYKAGVFVEQEKEEQALTLYRETITKYKEIGFEPGIIQSNIAIAKIQLKHKAFSEILKSMERMAPLAKGNNLLDEQTQISELSYLAHKNLGQIHLALTELEHFRTLNDSLFNIAKEEKINEIETRFETREKEQQIELLDRENKIKATQIRTRNTIVTALILLVLFTIVIFLLWQNKRKTLSELEIEKNKHRLLRAQMNPHFIYNALSAIQNFILKNNPMDSVTYISEFSSLTRLVLEGARSDLIILKEDIKLVNSYLKLQQLRFGNKFNFAIDVDADINDEIVKIPPMLSQPFIENAVEHGMRNKKQGEGEIKVSYRKEPSALVISISDNGEGIQSSEQNKTKKHKSLATKITSERIDNIKKMLNLNITLNVSSNETGTEIQIKIMQ